MNTDVYDILRDLDSVPTALKTLFDYSRKKDSSLSLAKLCRASGLASKGYLSEILRGVRQPRAHVASSIAQALGLKGLALKYVVTLAERDNLEAGPKRKQKTKELQAIRKGFDIHRPPVPENQVFSGFSMEVFCAFGLFHGRPTRRMLLDYFGHERADEMDASLTQLRQAKFIVGDEDGFHLLPASNHFAFSGSVSGNQHLEILRQAIYAAAEAVDVWFPRKTDSHIESMILSVSRSEYRIALQELKAYVSAWEARLETHDADSLIRVNIQIHPLGAVKGDGLIPPE